MASEFKELNNQFIKRPAVVLFRKPFVSNDEMSDILENMLDMEASVVQMSIKEYTAGTYKAVYWNHYTQKPIYDWYGSTNVFYRPYWCFYDKEEISGYTDLTGNNASEALNHLNDAYAALEKAKRDHDAASWWDKYIDNETTLNIYRKEDMVREAFSKLPEAIKQDERDKRTYTVWILDNSFDAPVQTKTYSAKNINEEDRLATDTNIGMEFYALNPKLFEELKQSSGKDIFADTEEGKKILEDARKRGIQEKNIKKYTFVVHKGIAMRVMTKKEISDTINAYNNLKTSQSWLMYDAMISDYEDWLKKKAFKNFLNTSLSDYFISKVVYESRRYAFLEVEISKFFLTDTFLSAKDNYKNYNYTKDPNITNFILDSLESTSLPFLSQELDKSGIAKNQEENIYFEYNKETKKIIVKASSNTAFNKLKVSDLLDAYLWFCRISNNEQNIPSDIKDSDDTKKVLDTLGYDTILRTKSALASYYIRRNLNNFYNVTLDKKILENLFLATEGDVKKVITRTSVSRKIKSKSIPTIFDFKIRYYLKIYDTYIRPRYEKYQDFIKSGLMKMYPQDMIEYIDIINKNKNNLTNSQKLGFINYFEGNVYDNLNGFYVTSTSELQEVVSPYSNTIIMEDNVDTISEEILSRLNTLTKSDNSMLAGVDNIANKDVSSLSVSRQTRGKSSASVVLKNLNNKYTISKGVNSGEAILEPMDEIYVYFPTFDEKLTLSFKGLVDSVQTINNKGYNSIGIQASCPIKKLELTRTNVKPSLSQAENLNSEVHPFIVPEDFFKSMPNWAPFMFMQALTFYSSLLESSTESDANTKIYEPVDGLPIFKDTLLQYLWYKKTNADNTQKRAATALKKLVGLYTSSVIQTNGDKPSNDKEEKGIIDPILTYREANGQGNSHLKIYYNIYAQRSDSVYCDYMLKQGKKTELLFDNRQLCGQFLATTQPAWSIGQQDINIIFSNYMTNYNILTDTSEKFNCYLYSNKNGVVQFRPPQIDVSLLSHEESSITSNIDLNRVLIEKDLTYEIRPDVFNNQTTTSIQADCNDSELVTWLQLSGENIWGGIGESAGNAIVVQDLPKSLKYGIKSQSAQTLCGVTNANALALYALSLMDRQNSLFMSCNVQGVASGDLDINKTVYIPSTNTIYLIDGLTLTYNPGGSFTYSAVLKWGRKPLFKVPLLELEYDNSLDKIDLRELDRKLLKAVNDNQITLAYYYQLKSYVDYVREYPDYSYILTSFIFNGYVWNGISSISFEDLLLTYTGEIKAQNTGLELALGISNTKFTTEDDKEKMQKKANQQILKELEILGGTMVRNVVINGSNIQKNLKIYTSKRST